MFKEGYEDWTKIMQHWDIQKLNERIYMMLTCLRKRPEPENFLADKMNMWDTGFYHERALFLSQLHEFKNLRTSPAENI